MTCCIIEDYLRQQCWDLLQHQSQTSWHSVFCSSDSSSSWSSPLLPEPHSCSCSSGSSHQKSPEDHEHFAQNYNNSPLGALVQECPWSLKYNFLKLKKVTSICQVKAMTKFELVSIHPDILLMPVHQLMPYSLERSLDSYANLGVQRWLQWGRIERLIVCNSIPDFGSNLISL